MRVCHLRMCMMCCVYAVIKQCGVWSNTLFVQLLWWWWHAQTLLETNQNQRKFEQVVRSHAGSSTSEPTGLVAVMFMFVCCTARSTLLFGLVGIGQ